ncbi:enterobactin synthase subunit EntD [[Enterobacter] lignolyticus]|uniref:Enterobactin synthase component D n=1 Tax=Enterobacter lignolyticus (strain SCF1) TaxID=701347 RepID=E3G5D3_ENTLS|nr:enterobactin synthase subunit EntD [[Enterobacter] lignolyticus]ADO49458.1 4'-phosphopantetheinyl transferase [[Enterobacter] lignolyticus SCF1]
MLTHHTRLVLHGTPLHRIDFAPATFTDADLFWLPHHQKLLNAGRKRKAEHLAGRIAAFYALREHGIPTIADIGERGQPTWPPGWFGSISHSTTTALAVVARQRVGMDNETRLQAGECEEIADSIACPDELARLRACRLPFPLALTLAFSAKESLYKALSDRFPDMPDFHAAQVTHIAEQQLMLHISQDIGPEYRDTRFPIRFHTDGSQVMTLAIVG